MPDTLPAVTLIETPVYDDERGFFSVPYEAERFRKEDLPTGWLQSNHSGSHRGVLRGLHYQTRHAQAKLVRVVVGEIYDVAVDLRRSSPAFGQAAAHRLSAENRRSVLVPKGFAHGFLVLSDWAEVLYQVDDIYAPDHQHSLRWDDPALGIDWPLREALPDGSAPILSDKDADAPLLADAETYA